MPHGENVLLEALPVQARGRTGSRMTAEGTTPRKRPIKQASLAIILALGVWALWPPAPEHDAPGGVDRGDAVEKTETRYVIKFSAGSFFLPDSRPFGLGKPLQGFKRVVRAFEERYPDTRIEFVLVPGNREYLVTQLSSGSAPDVLCVNVEDVWVDVQKDWYIPLDSYLEAPNPFVTEQGDPSLPGAQEWWDLFKYQAISRGKAAPDGNNYCINLDMIETAVFYNKTMFREAGVEPPETWDEFIHVLNVLQDHENPQGEDVIPLLLHLGAFHDWGSDLFFDQLYYDLLPGIDLVQDPVREAYLEGYLDWDELTFLNQKGFFTEQDPRYRELWRIMKELIPYCPRSLTATDFVREFVNQRGAMFWENCSYVYRFHADPNLEFEWGVFYLPRFTTHTSPYASGEPMCVIGGTANQFEVTNSAVGDTDPSLPLAERMQQSERLQRVIAFLQFMTLPENCDTIVNEFPGLLPNIVGVPVHPVLSEFETILKRRYTTTKWIYSYDLKFSDIQYRMLNLYLTGGLTLDDFLGEWQYANVRTAAENSIRRKNPDLDRLETAWQRLAPARQEMNGLPGG